MTHAENLARNKQIRKLLVKAFGSGVSVTQGRGTASGWCDINIDLPRKFYAVEYSDGPNYPKHTREAKDLMNDCYNFIEHEIRLFNFHRYQDDMGCEQEEFIIQVGFEPELKTVSR